MTIIRRFAVIALLLTFLAHAVAAQEMMEIHWTQAVNVGDRFRVAAEGLDEETTVRTFGGRQEAPNTSSLRLRFVANAEVRRVDEKNLVTEVAYEVEEFAVASEDQAIRPISSGQTLVATWGEDGEVSYAVDGEPVNSRIREILEILLEMPSGDPQDARFFDAGGPKAPGSEWPVDVDAVVANLREKSADVAPAGVSGTVKLIGGTEHKDVPTAHVRATLNVEGVTPPADAVPQGFVVKKLNIRNEIEAHLPLDEANPIPLVRSTGVREMRLEGRSGEQLILVVLEVTRRSAVRREVMRLEG